MHGCIQLGRLEIKKMRMIPNFFEDATKELSKIVTYTFGFKKNVTYIFIEYFIESSQFNFWCIKRRYIVL